MPESSEVAPSIATLEWAAGSGLILPRLLFCLAATRGGACTKAEAGPRRLGESTAFERSRARKSSARYSSAAERPLKTSAMVQRQAINPLRRVIKGLLKCRKT